MCRHQGRPLLPPNRRAEDASIGDGQKEVSLALGDLNKAQAETEAAPNGVHWQARFLRERHALGLAPLPPAPQSTPTASRIATMEQIHALALLSQRVNRPGFRGGPLV